MIVLSIRLLLGLILKNIISLNSSNENTSGTTKQLLDRIAHNNNIGEGQPTEAGIRIRVHVCRH